MKHGIGLTRQAISQHLDVLESAGLVTTVRQGKYKLHYLHPDRSKPFPSGGSNLAVRGVMRIVVTSVFVDDQDRALSFYTERLGFVKKTEIPLGDGMRWLTVVSPQPWMVPSSCSSPTAILRSARSNARSSRTAFLSPHLPSTMYRRSTSA